MSVDGHDLKSGRRTGGRGDERDGVPSADGQ